jgi:hypothetical protein
MSKPKKATFSDFKNLELIVKQKILFRDKVLSVQSTKVSMKRIIKHSPSKKYPRKKSSAKI